MSPRARCGQGWAQASVTGNRADHYISRAGGRFDYGISSGGDFNTCPPEPVSEIGKLPLIGNHSKGRTGLQRNLGQALDIALRDQRSNLEFLGVMGQHAQSGSPDAACSAEDGNAGFSFAHRGLVPTREVEDHQRNRSKGHTVHAIHDPAVPGEQFAGVLDPETTFETALHQV